MKPVQIYKDCVGVVDDDAVVRQALCLMLAGIGLEIHNYASAQEYLDDPVGRQCCKALVLDVRMPGISGMELQRKLAAQETRPAVVLVTGHGDVPMAVEAMRLGAVDFLQKPFNEQQLLDSVQKALAVSRLEHEKYIQNETARARLACLTPREVQVLKGLRRGLKTREIAAEMGITTKTAEEHRANLMRKMHASTIAEIIVLSNEGL